MPLLTHRWNPTGKTAYRTETEIKTAGETVTEIRVKETETLVMAAHPDKAPEMAMEARVQADKTVQVMEPEPAPMDNLP